MRPLRWGEGAAFNTWGVFVLTYAVTTVKMPKVEVLIAVTVGGLVSAAVVPLAGRLADRYGRRAVFATGCAVFGLAVFPAFAGLGTGSFAVVLARNISPALADASVFWIPVNWTIIT